MTEQENASSNSNFLRRLFAGALPIGIVCVLIWASSLDDWHAPVIDITLLVLAGVVLWFGWKVIRGNLMTRLVGYILGAFLLLVLGLFALGVMIPSLIIILIVGFPIVVYDLLLRSPRKGGLEQAANNRTNPPN